MYSFKNRLILTISLAMVLLTVWQIGHQKPAEERQTTLNSAKFGDIAAARSGERINALVLIFADTRQFSAQDLAWRIAADGNVAAVVDAGKAFKTLSADGQHCLDPQPIYDIILLLDKWTKIDNGKHIIAGIGDAALLPMLAAEASVDSDTEYLSIGFTSQLPQGIEVCPPWSMDGDKHALLASSTISAKANWHSVWTDQPTEATGRFIRALGNAHIDIAPYDTPLDQVLIDRIGSMLGQTTQAAPPLPIVEIPANRASNTLTLFYSGDGGWRDLDRAVAGEMAKAGFPIAGIDVLRYFWQAKTPEQTASDLSASMAYYRKQQGVQKFVLAGYSFGADILPAVYNLLPPSDQQAVELLVLLAVAEYADFEIHVSGWLGQASNEQPLTPELAKIPSNKLLCVYGREEKDHRGCRGLENSAAELLELPGGHHFDEDYPKLAQRILDSYRRHGIH